MKTWILALTLSVAAALPAAAQSRSAAYVAQVKADLIARRIIADPQTDNCDSFQITARVAYGLGAKLFLKSPAQNGCTWNGVRYSHDAIAFPDGWADVLVSAGPPANVNGPTWAFTPAVIDLSDPRKFAVAFNLDPVPPVAVDEPPPAPPIGVPVPPAPTVPPVIIVMPPAPQPAPLPSTDIAASLNRIEVELAGLKKDVAEFREAVRSKWVAFLNSPIIRYGAAIAAGMLARWKL